MPATFLSKIKTFFTFWRYFKKRKSSVVIAPKAKEQVTKGTNGPVKDNAMFVRHNGRTVLVLAADLGDIPSWIEYDSDTRQFSIVQNGGSVAYLDLFLQNEDQDAMKKNQRILLITKVKEQQVVHHLQFVVR